MFKGKYIEIGDLIKKEKPIGKKSWNWKGDKAGTFAFHTWVKRHKFKSNICEFCGEERDMYGKIKLELANIKNHQYTRNPDDYRWLHRSCHRRFDLLDDKSKIKKEIRKNVKL